MRVFSVNNTPALSLCAYLEVAIGAMANSTNRYHGAMARAEGCLAENLEVADKITSGKIVKCCGYSLIILSSRGRVEEW